jgi:hypothetical protein
MGLENLHRAESIREGTVLADLSRKRGKMALLNGPLQGEKGGRYLKEILSLCLRKYHAMRT